MNDEQLVQGESVVFRAVDFDRPADGDGRTLYARIVPYNTPAKVSDPPYFTPYQEAWRPEAFQSQLRAIGTPGERKVLLNWEHEPGILNVIGEAVGLESREDGLYGVFRIYNGPGGDTALQLLDSKAVTHVSLEANASKSEMRDGIVWRVAAKLKNVALARAGLAAFPQAQVLALRTEEPEPDPEPEPSDPDPPSDPTYISGVLARIGVEPLVATGVATRPWNGSVERFSPEEYQRSCLTAEGDTGLWPVLEPDGELNVNAMRNAAQSLNRSALPVSVKGRAARKLIRYYRFAGEEPPDSLSILASR
jgi:phage head maturation protease